MGVLTKPALLTREEMVGMGTRRQFIQTTAALGTVAVVGRACKTAEAKPLETPLPIPELRDARTNNNAINLTAAEGRHTFAENRVAKTYGFSAPYLGPVLMLHSGDEVKLAVENKLDHATTAHWHGVLVPAEVDGGPHLAIAPGETWRPTLKIDQPETTAWYHAHPHGDSGRQVYLGLAGMIIINDGSSQKLGLPRTYGIDDLPIILQDKSFDADGELFYSSTGPMRMAGMRGDTLIVNGVVAPVAKVPPGVVRLRVLNAANGRNFGISFDDGRVFHVIASDGGYVPAPVALRDLKVAPGERFEILVDFSDGMSAQLTTAADQVLMNDMGPGMTGEMTDSKAGALMRFDVDASLTAAVKTLPSALVPLAPPELARVVARRQISLDMGPAMMAAMRGGRRGMGGMGMGMGPPVGINGQVFDMARIDFQPQLGSTEIWEVSPSMMAHPFHVHGVIFRVLSVDGKPPAAHLAGGKDTILLDAPAELLMHFTQPATNETPFMFHCHILEHEDAGMMGQYAIV